MLKNFDGEDYCWTQNTIQAKKGKKKKKEIVQKGNDRKPQ